MSLIENVFTEAVLPAPAEAPPDRASLARNARPITRSSTAVKRPAWWLWPHLLSLDAPLVALIWQRWWAHTSGVRLTLAQQAILALGVWLIYLADRLADVSRANRGMHENRGIHETARHRFYGVCRHAMLAPALLIALGLGTLAPCALAPRRFAAGLGLLAIAGAYFWLIHRRKTLEWARLLPKEAVVGGIFAAGTGFFIAHQPGVGWPLFAGSFALFGGLCFLNCALITKWERNVSDLREQSSLLNSFPFLTSHLPAVCVLLAALSLGASALTGSVFFLPIGASAMLLTWLDGRRGSLSMDALRVLADIVLLTPIVCAGVL